MNVAEDKRFWSKGHWSTEKAREEKKASSSSYSSRLVETNRDGTSPCVHAILLTFECKDLLH